METNSFIDRAIKMMIQGIKLGTVVAFFSSIVYTLLYIMTISIMYIFAKPSGGITQLANISSFLGFLGFVMGLAGILPATFLGLVNGASLGFILALWGEKHLMLWQLLLVLCLGQQVY